MLGKLAITAPGFSCELGTPERKMLDAVAESISEAYIDQYLVGSLLDIEAKSGIELEQWVGIFGFGRLQGRKATGVVRVEMTTANTQDIAVNIGTQFFTRQGLPGTANPLFFASTQAAVIPAGTFVADIPVECTVIGTSGNLPPDSIVYLGEIIGASSVTNLTAMTGGVDAETDDELRQRFKDTFMRNVAGTEDWYLGLCYQNKNVSKAAVRRPDPQVRHPDQRAQRHPDAAGQCRRRQVRLAGRRDRSSRTSARPTRCSTGRSTTTSSSPAAARRSPGWGPGAMVEGDVVDVEFEYTTRSSRNDPLDGIINKVDVFANGADPYSITERTIVTAQTLSTNTADPLWTGNFARVGTPGNPSAVNRFMRLGSVPVLSFPSSIVVGTTNFQQGVHYHVLRGTTLVAGSIREVAGLEWLPGRTGDRHPADPDLHLQPRARGAQRGAEEEQAADHRRACAPGLLRLPEDLPVRRVRPGLRGVPGGQRHPGPAARLLRRAALRGLDRDQRPEPGRAPGDRRRQRQPDHRRRRTPVDYGIKVFGDSSDTRPGCPSMTDDFKLVDNQLPVFIEAVCLRKPNR